MSGQPPIGPDPNQPPIGQGGSGHGGGNPYVQNDPNQPRPFHLEPAPGGGNAKWIVLAVCAALFIPVMGCCVGLMLPAVQQAREAARRMSCSNNIKQIGIALHNYHSAYNQLPPAYTTDADGQPLHSWRTVILPFMEQQALYDQIDMSKPWNDPVNLAISQTQIPQYMCLSNIGDDVSTTYVAVVDPSGIMAGANAIGFRDVIDGLSNTIMLVECDSGLAVPWMQPTDISLQEFLDTGTARIMGGHQGGAHVLMGDGAVQFITDAADPQIREALITRAGKEIIE